MQRLGGLGRLHMNTFAIRLGILVIFCLLQAASYAITESEIVQAVRDFESNQSLEVTLENFDEWDAPIPNGHGNQTVYTAVVRSAGTLVATYDVTVGSLPQVVFVSYETVPAGAPVTEQEAAEIAKQYAAQKLTGFNASLYEATVVGCQLGEYGVELWHTLTNGARTQAGGCNVYVDADTGAVTAFQATVGSLTPDSESTPALSQEDALALARQRYPALATIEPKETAFTLTGDGWLCYEFEFPPQAGMPEEPPGRVIIDANSGEELLVDWWRGRGGASSDGRPKSGSVGARQSVSLVIAGGVALGLQSLVALLLWRRRKPL